MCAADVFRVNLVSGGSFCLRLQGQVAAVIFATTVAAISTIRAAGIPSTDMPRLSAAILTPSSGSIATPNPLKFEPNISTHSATFPASAVQVKAKLGTTNLTYAQSMLSSTTRQESPPWTALTLIRFCAMVLIALVAFTCFLHRWTSPRTLETLHRFRNQRATILQLKSDEGCSARQNLSATDPSGQRRQSVTCAAVIEHPHYSGPPA